jgi:hypothetical protein
MKPAVFLPASASRGAAASAAHQRLHAAHEGAAVVERVFVVQRDGFQGLADVLGQRCIHGVRCLQIEGAVRLGVAVRAAAQAFGRHKKAAQSVCPLQRYVFSFHAQIMRCKERIFLQSLAFMETLDKFDVAILQ